MSAAGFNSQMGQSQFLQLLIAQMKAQNPMEPTSSQEFLGQLAQFSTLSGIETLNANFSQMLSLQQLTQGANLIGKSVAYRDANGEAASGAVESVGVIEGKIQLGVNGVSVSLDQVVAIAAGT